jgi:hypothetical protein
MKYETKKILRIEELFANINYYKLWAGKHFGNYIIGLGNKGYRVSSTEEILNQVFMIPRYTAIGKPWGRNQSS